MAKKKISNQTNDPKTAVKVQDLKPTKNPKGGIGTKYTSVKWDGPDFDAITIKNR